MVKSASKTTNSRLTHGKESLCARRLNNWIARKGELERMGYMLGTNTSFNELKAAFSSDEFLFMNLFILGALLTFSPV